jgi:hypothetical protein
MALRVDPVCDFIREVDEAAWEEVFNVLAEPRFQFLRVLWINIWPGTSLHDADPVAETSQNMVAAHPSLATRGTRVSCDQIGSPCMFCSDNP